MENRELMSTIEAILFASGDSLPIERIMLVTEASFKEVSEAAELLKTEYEENRRGIRLLRLDNSLQLCSAPEFAPNILRAMEQRKPPKLSQTSLEVLAITAYFQPVTRAYIEQVRGVDSSYTVTLLAERGLIEACGKLEAPGRPTIYKTSELFLKTMGIAKLEDLPKLPDLTGDDAVVKLQEAIDTLSNDDADQIKIEGIN